MGEMEARAAKWVTACFSLSGNLETLLSPISEAFAFSIDNPDRSLLKLYSEGSLK
jgi:hypothetical protein